MQHSLGRRVREKMCCRVRKKVCAMTWYWVCEVGRSVCGRALHFAGLGPSSSSSVAALQ